MSAWIRLYLAVEGETELRFAKDTLMPHLAQFEVDVRPRMVLTNRKLGARGGALTYARLKRDTLRLMADDATPEARFSTMIDLYALPTDYPGWEAVQLDWPPAQRVAALEHAMAKEFDSPRFIPYLQLHEFEALLYCDLSQLRWRIEGSEKALDKLAAQVAGLAPEDIDERPAFAPSQRLVDHLPGYRSLKVRVGAPAAGAIGLSTLRTKCPHFDQWLTRLEALQVKSWPHG